MSLIQYLMGLTSKHKSVSSHQRAGFWLAGVTGSNATEPVVYPNQPSGTGYNAIELEVLPVLDLHEVCGYAVTTDLKQPPVSEAKSISCSVKKYAPGRIYLG